MGTLNRRTTQSGGTRRGSNAAGTFTPVGAAPRETGVALLGCGYWGKNLLRVLMESRGARVRQVVDLSSASREYVRSRYPELPVSGDESDVFDSDAVDAVVIATPANDHYRAASLALRAGKHAFVEKPLATSADDAEELVDRAGRKGLVLMAGHTFLFNSAVNHVKAMIDAGELGDVHYVHSRRLNLGIVRSDVNVLWNLAPHDVSIIQYWLDAEPEAVSAEGGIYLQPSLEDVVFSTLRFSAGQIANIHLSWLDPHKVRTATVVGSRKMVVLDDASNDARVVIYDVGVDVSTGTRRTDIPGGFLVSHRWGDTIIPNIPYPEPLAREMTHFLDCVRNGAEPVSGGRRAVSVVRTIERMQAALREGRPASRGAHGERPGRRGAQ